MTGTDNKNFYLDLESFSLRETKNRHHFILDSDKKF